MESERARRIRTADASARRLGRSPATRRARWKANERAVAAYLGGVRVPITGRSRGDAPDILHPWLSLEVKCWERLPERVADALHQAEACNVGIDAGSRLPLAVIRANGQQMGQALVVMRLGDFMDWFGGQSMPHSGAHESNGA